MRKKILVLGSDSEGADGDCGRRISSVLAADPEIECIIGGHPTHRGQQLAQEIRATFAVVDVREPRSITSALTDVFAVVNACGPFREHDYTMAEQCAQRGIHYIDMADTRAYVAGISELKTKAVRSHCAIVTGANTLPAVSSALIESLTRDFVKIDDIHIAISIESNNLRAFITIPEIVNCAGSVIRLKQNGHWRQAYGWSESRRLRFPEPIGKRRVFLFDAPDLDLLPQRYGATTVTFHTGLYSSIFNASLYLLAGLKRRGWVKDRSRLASFLAGIGKVFGVLLNTNASGMSILIRGVKDEKNHERQAYLVMRDGISPAIPCSPAIALIKKWVRDGVGETGAFPCVGLLTWDEIKAELLDHDIVVVLT